MMANDQVSNASVPDFYYGALHNQAGGFLEGVLRGAILRMGRW